jgi:hypothetical protein
LCEQTKASKIYLNRVVLLAFFARFFVCSKM